MFEKKKKESMSSVQSQTSNDEHCECGDCKCGEVCENCKRLEKENAELNDKLKRVLADYQNLKRRTAEEKSELSFYSNLSILGNLLDVSDDFDLAIEKYTKTEADEADWLTGIQMVRGKMGNLLENQQVTEIVCQLDDEFDPHFHEALSTLKVEDEKMDGIIMGIIRKGYMLGDRVLRPTRVVVGKYESA